MHAPRTPARLRLRQRLVREADPEPLVPNILKKILVCELILLTLISHDFYYHSFYRTSKVFLVWAFLRYALQYRDACTPTVNIVCIAHGGALTQ